MGNDVCHDMGDEQKSWTSVLRYFLRRDPKTVLRGNCQDYRIINHICNLTIQDEEVKKIIMEAYQRTHELLTEHREDVVKLAKQLMDFEVLTYRDVEKLIGPRKYPTKVSPSSVKQNLTFRESIFPRFSAKNPVLED